MTLIIEDGSIVTGARSYVSRADYIAYALTLGVTIADTSAADVQLVKSAQFIDSHDSRLKGTRRSRDQPMAFPRDNVVIDGFSWASDEIPRQVILCQLAVALDVNAGIDPYNQPTNPARTKKSERIEGAIDVEYFGNDSAVKMSRDSTAKALLSCLLKSAGLSIALVRA